MHLQNPFEKTVPVAGMGRKLPPQFLQSKTQINAQPAAAAALVLYSPEHCHFTWRNPVPNHFRAGREN
jgi:hypothetical protein